MVENKEQEKGKTFIIKDIIEYLPNCIVTRTIIKRITGNVSVVSFDSGEAMIERTSAFDNLIQIIDGNAEIVIQNEIHLLNTEQSIIIPAHSRNSIRANVRFKMISTVIKSGYEEVS